MHRMVGKTLSLSALKRRKHIKPLHYNGAYYSRTLKFITLYTKGLVKAKFMQRYHSRSVFELDDLYAPMVRGFFSRYSVPQHRNGVVMQCALCKVLFYQRDVDGSTEHTDSDKILYIYWYCTRKIHFSTGRYTAV